MRVYKLVFWLFFVLQLNFLITENRPREIVDPNCEGVQVESLDALLSVAIQCVSSSPEDRPTMHRVVQVLESEVMTPCPSDFYDSSCDWNPFSDSEDMFEFTSITAASGKNKEAMHKHEKEGLESAAALYLHFIRSFFLQMYHNSLIEEHTISSGSLGTKLIAHRLEFSCPRLAWVCKKTCLNDNGVSDLWYGPFIHQKLSFFGSPLFPSHVCSPHLAFVHPNFNCIWNLYKIENIILPLQKGFSFSPFL